MNERIEKKISTWAALAIRLGSISNALADIWSEAPLSSNPQKVEWIITKDNWTTFVKFVNVSRYYSFNNKPSFLSTLLAAKSSGLSIRISSTTAASGETTNGLPDLGNSNQSYQMGGVFLLN